jgi:hypothetical protein
MIYVAVAVAAVIGLFVAIVAMQAAEFRVERQATMAAAPAEIFDQVNDLHKWVAWSPWEKLDPALKRTYDGPSEGTGAGYSWAGNKQVGEGRMTVLESRPNELIRLQVEFLKPFKATNIAEFTFKPEAAGTVVTWSMSGRKNFMMKMFSLTMSMDKMIGGDFEKGLATMKTLVERGQKS